MKFFMRLEMCWTLQRNIFHRNSIASHITNWSVDLPFQIRIDIYISQDLLLNYVTLFAALESGVYSEKDILSWYHLGVFFYCCTNTLWFLFSNGNLLSNDLQLLPKNFKIQFYTHFIVFHLFMIPFYASVHPCCVTSLRLPSFH